MTAPLTPEALVQALVTCLAENDHRSRYRQALALLAGPLVPIITDAAEARAAHQQVTAERDEARAEVERLRAVLDFEKRAHRVVAAELARLRAEGEALREDAARLDFLDGCNARLNASYGTHYGWKLVLNHNVNRLMLGDLKVDLHDSQGGNDKLPSCRLAIDEARKRTALARAATAREG